MTRLTKLRDLVIYKDPYYYCGPGPSSCLLPDGCLIVAFRRWRSWVQEGFWDHIHPTTQACLVTSTDGGQTWDKPRVFDTGCFDSPNLTLLSDGTLLYVTHDAEILPKVLYERWQDHPATVYAPRSDWAFLDNGARVLRSTDGGQTWQGPYLVSPVPGFGSPLPNAPSPVHQRGPAIQLDNGEVVLAVHASARKGEPMYSVLMVSGDGGLNWQYRSEIARDPNGKISFVEACIYQTPRGKLVAFLRTGDAGGGWLYVATSTDLGKTWSKAENSGIWGYPPHALRMSDSLVLLSYGYRHEPMGVRARLLDAECEHLDSEELVLRDDGTVADLGYPNATLLPDGTAFVSYYFNGEDGVRYIAATLAKAEV